MDRLFWGSFERDQMSPETGWYQVAVSMPSKGQWNLLEFEPYPVMLIDSSSYISYTLFKLKQSVNSLEVISGLEWRSITVRYVMRLWTATSLNSATGAGNISVLTPTMRTRLVLRLIPSIWVINTVNLV